MDDRRRLLQQKGCIVWITGLSGSGKSTVAFAMDRILNSMAKVSYVLDGDKIREGLCKDLGFSAEDRRENIRRVGETAALFADAGLIAVVSFISPYKRDRDIVRELVPTGNFIEVFMDVPLEVCEERDAKGLYKLARQGVIKAFTGIDDPYEKPVNPEIVIKAVNEHGACYSPDEMARIIIHHLSEKGFLSDRVDGWNLPQNPGFVSRQDPLVGPNPPELRSYPGEAEAGVSSKAGLSRSGETSKFYGRGPDRNFATELASAGEMSGTPPTSAWSGQQAWMDAL
ncbi:hypothetical protein AXG93_1774s1240 [Marchantia polymorpha subsp. ruderalis]|uniref:Adenylyl-sulfate kinase n=1 Tax=Marchantia polymorpha subsp. ruderalis TaxID=1480154 RepID=A0A176W1S9_MARPO|nr:hypothetical protein AXG93_1774s1240 [Marchantia polymorpha subsp. ruderalis]